MCQVIACNRWIAPGLSIPKILCFGYASRQYSLESKFRNRNSMDSRSWTTIDAPQICFGTGRRPAIIFEIRGYTKAMCRVQNGQNVQIQKSACNFYMKAMFVWKRNCALGERQKLVVIISDLPNMIFLGPSTKLRKLRVLSGWVCKHEEEETAKLIELTVVVYYKSQTRLIGPSNPLSTACALLSHEGYTTIYLPKRYTSNANKHSSSPVASYQEINYRVLDTHKFLFDAPIRIAHISISSHRMHRGPAFASRLKGAYACPVLYNYHCISINYRKN